MPCFVSTVFRRASPAHADAMPRADWRSRTSYRSPERPQERRRILAALEHLDERRADDHAVGMPPDPLDLRALAYAEAGADREIRRGLHGCKIVGEPRRQIAGAGDAGALHGIDEPGARGGQ